MKHIATCKSANKIVQYIKRVQYEKRYKMKIVQYEESATWKRYNKEIVHHEKSAT